LSAASVFDVPYPSLIILVGVSGSGKSTFCQRNFERYETLSGDVFRGLVADDEADQAATADAFAVLNCVALYRLARGRLTVVDATHLRQRDRARRLDLARESRVPALALVFNIPLAVCLLRDSLRADRKVGAEVIRQQYESLKRALPELRDEDFDAIHFLNSVAEADSTSIRRHA
jgi:protein phosphatase